MVMVRERSGGEPADVSLMPLDMTYRCHLGHLRTRVAETNCGHRSRPEKPVATRWPVASRSLIVDR